MKNKTDIKTLKDEMCNRVVSFHFLDSDGKVQTAKGTTMRELIEEKMGENIVFDRKSIDSLIEAKNIRDIKEYALENGITLVNSDESNYIFRQINETLKEDEEGIYYYDVDNETFNVLKNNDFIKIIS